MWTEAYAPLSEVSGSLSTISDWTELNLTGRSGAWKGPYRSRQDLAP